MARTVPLAVLRVVRVAARVVTPAAVLPGALQAERLVAPIVVALAAVLRVVRVAARVVTPAALRVALAVRPAAVRVVPAAAPLAALAVKLVAVRVVPAAALQVVPTPNNPRR